MPNIPALDRIEIDTAGYRHIFCTEGEAIDLVYSQIQELDCMTQDIQILCIGKPEVASDSFELNCFDSPKSLLSKLQVILDRSYMGTRLYAIGSKQFVGNCRNYAYRWGMSDKEITWQITSDRDRRVFCSTCHGTSDRVNTDIITCSSCGLKLEVWQHFSSLKNAYLGVCIDAEIPIKN